MHSLSINMHIKSMGFGIINKTQAKAKEDDDKAAEEVAWAVAEAYRRFMLHAKNSVNFHENDA